MQGWHMESFLYLWNEIRLHPILLMFIQVSYYFQINLKWLLLFELLLLH